MHHIGIGRTQARTHVLLLVQDLQVRIVNAVTGELLREPLSPRSRALYAAEECGGNACGGRCVPYL